MNFYDEQIDHALEVVRTSEPRNGVDAMNRRLLTRLNAHLAEGANASLTLRQRFSTIAPWQVPLAAAVLSATVLFLLTISFSHHRAAISVATKVAPTATSSPHPSRRSVSPSERSSVPVANTLDSSTSHRTLLRTEKGKPAASVVSGPAAERSDTNLPSHPAPPMALTAQERLLLRAAYPNSPTELAELEPLREVAERQSSAAHQRARIERFVERMLAPIAASETLNPASSTEQTSRSEPSRENTAPDSNQHEQ